MARQGRQLRPAGRVRRSASSASCTGRFDTVVGPASRGRCLNARGAARWWCGSPARGVPCDSASLRRPPVGDRVAARRHRGAESGSERSWRLPVAPPPSVTRRSVCASLRSTARSRARPKSLRPDAAPVYQVLADGSLAHTARGARRLKLPRRRAAGLVIVLPAGRWSPGRRRRRVPSANCSRHWSASGTRCRGRGLHLVDAPLTGNRAAPRCWRGCHSRVRRRRRAFREPRNRRRCRVRSLPVGGHAEGAVCLGRGATLAVDGGGRAARAAASGRPRRSAPPAASTPRRSARTGWSPRPSPTRRRACCCAPASAPARRGGRSRCGGSRCAGWR